MREPQCVGGKNGCLGAVLAELRGCVLYLNYDKRFGCLQFPFFSRVPHRLLIWLLLDFLFLLLSFTLLCVLEAAGAPNIYFQFLYEECRRIFYAAPLAVVMRTCRSPGFERDLRWKIDNACLKLLLHCLWGVICGVIWCVCCPAGGVRHIYDDLTLAVIWCRHEIRCGNQNNLVSGVVVWRWKDGSQKSHFSPATYLRKPQPARAWNVK